MLFMLIFSPLEQYDINIVYAITYREFFFPNFILPLFLICLFFYLFIFL